MEYLRDEPKGAGQTGERVVMSEIEPKVLRKHLSGLVLKVWVSAHPVGSIYDSGHSH